MKQASIDRGKLYQGRDGSLRRVIGIERLFGAGEATVTWSRAREGSGMRPRNGICSLRTFARWACVEIQTE